MNVVIRVDASSLIGVGHLVRCLALAEQLVTHGERITFITRDLPGHVAHLFRQTSFSVCLLPDVAAHLSDDDFQKLDAEQVAGLLEVQAPIDWLIVDHYRLDRQWEERVRVHVGKILVIDDLADREHDCDILVDHGFHADMVGRYQKLVPLDCVQLLGPRFALLRQPFCAAASGRHVRSGKVQRLLVTFGGADTHDATSLVIDAILGLGKGDLHVDVVVGSVHGKDIRERCREYPNFTCHADVDVHAIIDLMAVADLAICGAGGTTWERCALALPAIVIAIADNQEPIAQSLASHSQIFYLGRQDEVDASLLVKALDTVMHMPLMISALSRSNAELVDGRGIARVASCMVRCRSIRLRLATDQDNESIFAWRNDEETRRYFHNPAPISREEHQFWFSNTLADPDKVLLVGESDHGPIGVLRYDITETTATTSIYLVPGKAGQGYGASLLTCGNNWLRRNRSDISAVRAEVLPGNTRSVKAFAKAGFQLIYSEFRVQL